MFKIIDLNRDYFNGLCYTESINEEERLLEFLSSKSEKEIKVTSEGDAFMDPIKEEVNRLNLSEKTLDELYVEGEEQIIRNTERKIGREEAHKEKSIEIAKNMLEMNLAVKQFSKRQA